MNIKSKLYTIDIDLESGVYTFSVIGATGKTYLGKVLDMLTRVGLCKACYITYHENWDTQDYIKELERSKCDIYLLDRFDCYFDEEIVQYVLKLQDAIVLIDWKTFFEFSRKYTNIGIADLYFDGGEFTVRV